MMCLVITVRFTGITFSPITQLASKNHPWSSNHLLPRRLNHTKPFESTKLFNTSMSFVFHTKKQPKNLFVTFIFRSWLMAYFKIKGIKIDKIEDLRDSLRQWSRSWWWNELRSDRCYFLIRNGSRQRNGIEAKLESTVKPTRNLGFLWESVRSKMKDRIAVYPEIKIRIDDWRGSLRKGSITKKKNTIFFEKKKKKTK